MSGHHPYLLSHHAEKLENVFIENFLAEKTGFQAASVKTSKDNLLFSVGHNLKNKM